MKDYYDFLERTGYYLSCMLIFNTIYLIRLSDEYVTQFYQMYSLSSISHVSMLLCGSLLIFGIITTIYIVKRDYSIKDMHDKGMTITVSNVENVTEKLYFANFSILILTAVSIPANGDIVGLMIYVIILLAIGLVYIKNNQIQINPILTLMNFKTYKCIDKESGNSYIILVRNKTILENEGIRFQNTPKHIIILDYKR